MNAAGEVVACEGCGGAYVCKRARQRFCSSPCAAAHRKPGSGSAVAPAFRACEICGALYAASKGKQFCSYACRSAWHRARGGQRRRAQRDSVAPALVRGWDPGKRARIRSVALQLGQDGLVELIDKITAEEAVITG